MGTKFNPLEAQTGNFSSDKRVHWQTICELLSDRHYEQAARHLNTLQFPEHGDDPYLTSILAAAHQICLVCQQICAETDLHQQAYHETMQRERELQQQLTLIFDLIERYLEPGKLPGSLPDDLTQVESVRAGVQRDGGENGRSWWQRLRDRFEPKSGKVAELFVPESVEAAGETAVFSKPDSEPLQSPTKKTGDLANPTLTVYCLGSFRTYINDNWVENWNGNNARAIFKYMVVNRKRPIPLEVLMDLFWRDDEPESARRNLYQAIYLLRQALQIGAVDFPCVLSTNGCYGLNPDLRIWLDSEAFEIHYHNGQKLEMNGSSLEAIREYEAADTLYEGDFLAEDIYEEWPAALRQQLKSAYLDILDRLSRYHYQQKNWAMSVAYSQKLLHADACREDAHRGLMRAYFHLGQRHLALRQYHHCIETLRDELGVSPAQQTIDLYHQIKDGGLQ